MIDRNKPSHSLNDAFYWKVPGDVPGWRSKADPFQSRRSEQNPNYQFIPKLEIAKSKMHDLDDRATKASSSKPKSRPEPDLELSNSRELVDPQTNNSVSTTLPNLFLLSVILMLFLFVDYQNKPLELVTENNIVQKQIVIEPRPEASVKPKVFQITLGEKTKTAESTLREITHVVVKGDTLWDISETYVKNPFRYPELAKLSSIINPDLIYPNDLIRIHIYN